MSQKEYKPEYERLKAEKETALVEHQAKQLERIKIDVVEDEKEKRRILGSAYEKAHNDINADRFHIGGAELEDEEDEQQIAYDADYDDPEGKAFEELVKNKMEAKS
uniref:Uncharacterized protein n=1 Tax=Romanomermis culicivorax TaxID=13658 RepID=A0A915K7C4_ROMCU